MFKPNKDNPQEAWSREILSHEGDSRSSEMAIDYVTFGLYHISREKSDLVRTTID